jgi:polyisoprenoid-binding protein YceI
VRGFNIPSAARNPYHYSHFRDRWILPLRGIARDDKSSAHWLCIVLWLISPPTLLPGQPKPIDPAQSVITIHVGKSGFFSTFGHNHEVRAPIAEGVIDENPANPGVQFRVDARELKVLDPDVKESERAEVQRTMLGPEVLDSEKFPEIRFRSTSVDRVADSKWKVSGDLTLHGQTRPVHGLVTGSAGRYRGTAEFKQTTFAIKPVAVAGGTVKVKDELRIDFQIATR